MAAPPFVVLCWETDPGYVPPLRISPHQHTIGVRPAHPSNIATCDNPPDSLVPPGAYDLEATLHAAGVLAAPDLIVVWSSALRANLPTNLAAFRCPKLLVCGDTHHMQQPIRCMLGYACAERFDAVASVYDRHHLHWFLAAGFTHCAWLPGLTVQPLAPAWSSQRQDQVALVGQAGAMHAWRAALLQRIADAGIPLRAGLATRAQAAALYGQSLVSFNASLNGDLNMRVFEVLAAGGFLLTDRLSPQAGLEALLRPGEDCEIYGDADELLDKLDFYRRSPEAALRIAECGSATFRRSLLAAQRIGVLRDWMLSGALPDLCNPRHDLRAPFSQAAAAQLALRVAVYEALQERQRQQPSLSVLVPSDWPAAAVLDLADLVRVNVTVVTPAPALRAAAAAASVLPALSFVTPDAACGSHWDVVLTSRADAGGEPWRARAGQVLYAAFTPPDCVAG